MNRRRQRETALQVLFQAELARISGEEAFTRTLAVLDLEDRGLSFARELVTGVCSRREQLDRVIAGISRNWRLERIAVVDRNIIRIALFEIFFRPDIPPNVSLNEAIELAKVYGTDESGRFVNGILGKVMEQPEAYRPDEAELNQG